MTNVIPTAMMAVMEACNVTLRRLSALKKYGERTEKTRTSRMNATPIPSSPESLDRKLPVWSI